LGEAEKMKQNTQSKEESLEANAKADVAGASSVSPLPSKRSISYHRGTCDTCKSRNIIVVHFGYYTQPERDYRVCAKCVRKYGWLPADKAILKEDVKKELMKHITKEHIKKDCICEVLKELKL
jgi:alkylated DNA repair dioxygenase AlkB